MVSRRTKLRRVLATFGRVALWLVLLLAGAELSLRAAGWYILRSRARAAEANLPADAYRMLFIGESTTYGLWVEPDEAYPAQVAALLGAKHASRRFLAFNRGVPSLTTTAMVRTLPEKLRLLSPQMVLILAGVNDFHTQYNGLRVPGEGWLPRPVADLIGSSRVYRLIDVWIQLRRPKVKMAGGAWLDERGPPGVSLAQRELFYDFGSGHHLLYDPVPGDEPKAAGAIRTFEANLERMIALCRESGAQVVLIGYLGSTRENEIIERVAKRAGVAFVPTWTLSDRAQVLMPSLFMRDTFHPSKAGYRMMAERIVDGIDPLITVAR